MENGQEPATKQDIGELRAETAALRAELKQDIGKLRAELKQDIEQSRAESRHEFDDLRETFRDGQTELLRAFYSYAQSTDAKLKESEIADMLLRSRLSAVESRVTEIERRMNQPPPQTH